MHAIDFGTGQALKIWSDGGPVPKKSLSIPRVVGGKTPKDEFLGVLHAILPHDDVVVESPTIGSSGAEPDDVHALLTEYEHVLWTVSARAVKNYRKDHGLGWRKGARYAHDGDAPPTFIAVHTQQDAHEEDAQIIHKIATETPYRLRPWHISVPCNRVYSSVRPSDKRGYRDDRTRLFMQSLPDFDSLPEDLKGVLGVRNGGYSASMVLPFAMALNEPFLDIGPVEERRNRFSKVLGAYDHGYPSFYRRMVTTWMQKNAKKLADVEKIEQVPAAIRKEAWKLTRKQIRHLYHLSQEQARICA